MDKPLNRRLYDNLKRVFRRVKISNAGCGMLSRHGPDPVTGETRFMVEDPGEYYCVCCPRCHDTRFRLRINHRWGVRDKITGNLNLFLVNCRNEHCYRTSTAREQLYQIVSEGASLAEAHVDAGDTSGLARNIEMPGIVIPLDKLPVTHPACCYMAERHYDPVRLGQFYKVGYCAESDYYLANNRIIIPAYMDGELKGWQARYIGEMDWKAEGAPPKYWTSPGMQRGKILHNFDAAKEYSTCVMVEGPLDVFSFGSMAVGCFGFPPTNDQIRLVVSAFDQVVLLFDADILDKETTRNQYDKILGELQKQMPGAVAAVQLPHGDPGNFERGFLRDFTAEAAAKQGVAIRWNQINSRRLLPEPIHYLKKPERA